MLRLQMKTFMDANPEALDQRFNDWAVAYTGASIEFKSSQMLFSPALQKFVFTIVFTTEFPQDDEDTNS